VIFLEKKRNKRALRILQTASRAGPQSDLKIDAIELK